MVSVLPNVGALIVRADYGLAEALQGHPLVLWVSRGDRLYAAPSGNALSSAIGVDWHVKAVRAHLAWRLGLNGSGVIVAVVDSGVDPGALGGIELAGWARVSRDGRVACGGRPWDDLGHGTMVSGILLSIAPGARLAVAKAVDNGAASLAQIAAAIDWALGPRCRGQASLKADVILLPLAVMDYYGWDLLPAIARALESGAVVVAAVGNWGPGRVGYPSNVWGVVAVGAVDRFGLPASFSGGGVVDWPEPPERWPFMGGYPSEYLKPDLAAPGVGVPTVSPGGSRVALTGTSAAAPIVAGVAALVVQALKGLGAQAGPELVYEALIEGARDAWKPGPDTRTGWGVVDAYSSVRRALEAAGAPRMLILDSSTLEPIPWAWVDLGAGPAPAEGGVALLPPGAAGAEVLVGAWGYRPARATVLAGGSALAALDRLPHGLIEVSVSGARGYPPARVEVAVEGGPVIASSEGPGTLKAWLPAGAHAIRVGAPGYGYKTLWVEVEPGATLRVNVTLERGPRLAVLGPPDFLEGIEYAMGVAAPYVSVVRALDVGELEGSGPVDAVIVSPGYGLLDPSEAAERLIDYAAAQGALLVLPVTGLSPLPILVLERLGVKGELAPLPAPPKLALHPFFEGLESGALLAPGAPGVRLDASGQNVEVIAWSGGVAAALLVRSGGLDVAVVSYSLALNPVIAGNIASYAAGPRPTGPLGAYTSTTGGSVIMRYNGSCLGGVTVSRIDAVSRPLGPGLVVLEQLPPLPPGGYVAAVRGCGGELLAWHILYYKPVLRVNPPRAAGGEDVRLTLLAHEPGVYRVLVNGAQAGVAVVSSDGTGVTVVRAPKRPGLYEVSVAGPDGSSAASHAALLVMPAGGLDVDVDATLLDGALGTALFQVVASYAGGPAGGAKLYYSVACGSVIWGPHEAGPGVYLILVGAAGPCPPTLRVTVILWPLEAEASATAAPGARPLTPR